MIQLPHDEKLEAIVLGTLMTFPNSINEVGNMLHDNYFFKPFHKDVLKAIKELISERKSVDILSVNQQLNNPKLAYEITKLTENVVSKLVIQKVHFLAELHFKRKLLELNFVAFTDLNNGKDVFEMKEFVTRGLLDLQNEIQGIKGEKEFSKIVDEVEKDIDIAMQNPDHVSGIPTGHSMLDRLTGGWQNSDLIIIAARPSMGKTARCLNFLKVAVDSGKKALFMSLEMSSHQLVKRLLAEGSGLDLQDINRGRLSHYSRQEIANIAKALKTLPITINDNGRTTIFDIAANCRILKSQDKLDILIVDYLQILNGGKVKVGNRNELIGLFTGEFKNIAKECNIPVILLSQLNRNNESSSDKRPELQHLKDSGSIEQDADFVGFIYRPSYYTKNDQSKETDEDFKAMDEKEYLMYSEFIVAKNRNGKLGFIKEYFNGSTQRFTENLNVESKEDFSFSNIPF
jgi:replicative DNA helicase